ncbi:unnamed protein product [Thelazia callipaeda]|uniref:Beta_helix domain-containing protein n=1 Tax=Thelazia callipaeda TaxID=103827 RepID=A0A0N5DA69_THECL|nr:unnamed protein product [Thelazia callipaeda]
MTVTKNCGDGIHYREAFGEYCILLQLIKNKYRKVTKLSVNSHTVSMMTMLDMCNEHKIPSNFYFANAIHANLITATVIDSNSETPCWMHLINGLSGRVAGDIHVIFRIHVFLTGKAFYSLNITYSVTANNAGNGILVREVRKHTAFTNITVVGNEGQAGILVNNGAADIWINASYIDHNWGDGINVTYSGGSVTINGTTISHNRWRELTANRYHASIEIFACQKAGMANIIIDFTGNRVEDGLEVGFRMKPAVNIIMIISNNQFIANNDSALIIRNARYPYLHNLPAQVNFKTSSSFYCEW